MIEAIRDFLCAHPWWHTILVAIAVAVPSAFGMYYSWRAGRTTADAAGLTRELGDAKARIANLQVGHDKLEIERNRALAQVALHASRPVSIGEQNALKLRQYLGMTAKIGEVSRGWGGMGAEIVAVSGDGILTLFVPAGFYSATAYSVSVQCDKLQITEVPDGEYALQIRILERYGDTAHWGGIRKWEERSTSPVVPRPRGGNVFHSIYRIEGSSSKRSIFIYAPARDNPEFTMAICSDENETATLYGDRVEISKRFALLQIEWFAAGYVRDGGGGDGNVERLFLFTH